MEKYWNFDDEDEDNLDDFHSEDDDDLISDDEEYVINGSMHHTALWQHVKPQIHLSHLN